MQENCISLSVDESYLKIFPQGLDKLVFVFSV